MWERVREGESGEERVCMEEKVWESVGEKVCGRQCGKRVGESVSVCERERVGKRERVGGRVCGRERECVGETVWKRGGRA